MEKGCKLTSSLKAAIRVGKTSSTVGALLRGEKSDTEAVVDVSINKKLSASQFRRTNEELYKSPSNENYKRIGECPEIFNRYHENYRQQIECWTLNPLDEITRQMKEQLESVEPRKAPLIVDLGCGDAGLCKNLTSWGLEKKRSIHVRNFDLIERDGPPKIERANIASLVPIAHGLADVVVLSLALMGSDWPLIILQANKILRLRGFLYLAEVEARFTDLKKFRNCLRVCGWKLKNEVESGYFRLFILQKVTNVERFGRGRPKRNEIKPSMPSHLLKSCDYKKR